MLIFSPRIEPELCYPDEDIPSTHSSPPPNKSASEIVGPSTRSRAKQLEQQIHSLVNTNLILTNQIILDHSMLLSTCLKVLRNDGLCERAWDDDDFCPPKQ